MLLPMCACIHQGVAPTGFANTQERYSYRIPTVSGLPTGLEPSYPVCVHIYWYVHRSGRVCLRFYSYRSIPQASVDSLTLILRCCIRSQLARPDGLPTSELDHEITRAVSTVSRWLLMGGSSRTTDWITLRWCPGGRRESAEVPGGPAGAHVVCEQRQYSIVGAGASQMMSCLLGDCVR